MWRKLCQLLKRTSKKTSGDVMPVYVFRCEEGHKFDKYLKLADYDKPQTCRCGASAKRQIVPTMLNCDMQPWDRYVSPATGKVITSYKERKEDMARSGCVDYDPGVKNDYQSRIKRGEAELDKKVDETVEKEFEKMSSSKKEKLANELLSGAEVEYKRL